MTVADPTVAPMNDRRISHFPSTGKEKYAKVSQVIRSERRSESLRAAGLMALLLAILLYYVLLVSLGIVFNWDQRTIAFWLGMVFLVGATQMTIYRKHFQRDVIVAKKRHKKTTPSANVDWWRFK